MRTVKRAATAPGNPSSGTPRHGPLRTTDPVPLSWVSAPFDDADVAAVVFDTHLAIPDGSIGTPSRRLMVADGTARQEDSELP